MDAFMGTILPWAMNYAPQYWNNCDGTAIPVNQNQALYALLGNTYGGNQSVFNLPDLRGKVPVGMDPGGSSGNVFNLGTKGGANQGSITVGLQNIPSHMHTAQVPASTAAGILPSISGTLGVSAAAATTGTPTSTAVPAQLQAIAGSAIKAYGAADGTTQWPVTVTPRSTSIPVNIPGANFNTGATGSGLPISFNNMQSYLTINYIICTYGIFPTRP